jgi:hypothetical protein
MGETRYSHLFMKVKNIGCGSLVNSRGTTGCLKTNVERLSRTRCGITRKQRVNLTGNPGPPYMFLPVQLRSELALNSSNGAGSGEYELQKVFSDRISLLYSVSCILCSSNNPWQTAARLIS